MNLSEILPSVRQLSTSEKLKLIRLIAEELETAENIAPLEPFKTYDLPTPDNTFEKESKNIDLKAVHQICDRVRNLPVLDDRAPDEIIGYNEFGGLD